MTAGVYKIENVVTGEFYIGGSKNIKQRWQMHRYTLNAGKHPSSDLQQDWNTYGVANFKFTILCITDPDMCKFFESRFIAKLKPEYNTCMLNKHREGASKYKNPDGYSFVSPDGVLYEGIKNLYLFCTEHGLTHSTMHDLCTGKDGRNQHKGWRLANNPIPKYDFVSPDDIEYLGVEDVRSFEKEHGLAHNSLYPLCSGKVKETHYWILKGTKHKVDASFLSPDGTLFKHVHNIYAFAKKRNLNPGNLYMLMNGKYRMYLGWTCIDSKNAKAMSTLISPDGTEYKHVFNLAKFAREHGLQPSTLNDMRLHGQPEKHKGWKLITENFV
jgi:hypothetical protein